MRISVLKAATYPDAHQDEGRHVTAFGVYPHVAALEQSDVIEYARAFNNPLQLRPGSIARDVPEIAVHAHEGLVVLDTIKRSEGDFDYRDTKGRGTSVTVRLYEAVGARTQATLRT